MGGGDGSVFLRTNQEETEESERHFIRIGITIIRHTDEETSLDTWNSMQRELKKSIGNFKNIYKILTIYLNNYFMCNE